MFDVILFPKSGVTATVLQDASAERTVYGPNACESKGLLGTGRQTPCQGTRPTTIIRSCRPGALTRRSGFTVPMYADNQKAAPRELGGWDAASGDANKVEPIQKNLSERVYTLQGVFFQICQ
jgi:hypothetical protein